MPLTTRTTLPTDVPQPPSHHDEPEGDVPTVPPTVNAKPTLPSTTSAPPVVVAVVPDALPATPSPSSNVDAARLAQTKQALYHSWKGYQVNAFGKDEFLPLSNTAKNWGNGNGIGVTMIDGLDTLILAGFQKEADEVMDYIEQHISYDQDIKVSVFETSIRVLGGLLSAFQLTGREGLKRQAVDLGNRLMHAFNTPSGVPDNYVNLRSGHHEGAGWNGGLAILSELGSLQMEFRALTDITGDPKYDMTAQRAIQAIRPSCGALCPRNFRGSSGTGGNAALGSFGDSFYEYLLKYWIQVGRESDMYKEMWDRAAEHILRTSKATGEYLVPNGAETGMTMEHLACFSGGLFALSSVENRNPEHLKLAEDIANTCHAMYATTATKLAPDVAHVGPHSISSGDPKFILRPETVETYFYLWRVTRNPKYREWGAEVLDACDRHLKVDRGYVGSTNVNVVPTPHNDMLETFWLAETLKYLLLLFSDDSALDLKEFVLNTEAHPLRIRHGGGR
ncbi:glycoside hydrolase, putative [Bodo saltans]|uniref:alpha-1,2-Mannosidase n=1 Tax=Bodo saltans TaxID=75058 RepID=A0A0S4IZ63_BODSA|nr:glycoside hydrolase, putative [Bodo saltans]|eukprot:CUG22805.1 glycoside hydrolase, putative [Bodo saltans]